MILPVLTFFFGLWQVLTLRYDNSQNVRYIAGVTAICLSAIPLMIQFVILVDELCRAKQHFPRLLLHRFLMNVLGDYGPTMNLIAKYYSSHPRELTFVKNFRMMRYDISGWFYRDLTVHFRMSLDLYRAISFIVFGALVFSDAFSGMFNTRRISTALWLDREDDQWGLPVDGKSEWAEKRWEEIKVKEIVGLKYLRDLRNSAFGADVEGGGGIGEEVVSKQVNKWNRWNRWRSPLVGDLIIGQMVGKVLIELPLWMASLIFSVIEEVMMRGLSTMSGGSRVGADGVEGGEERGDDHEGRDEREGDGGHGDGGTDEDGSGDVGENGPDGGGGAERNETEHVRSDAWLHGLLTEIDGDVSGLLELWQRSEFWEGGAESSESMDWSDVVDEAGWEVLEKMYMTERRFKMFSRRMLWGKLEAVKQFTLIWQLNQKMSKPGLQDAHGKLAGLLQQAENLGKHMVSKVIRHKNLSATFYSATESKLKYHILATGSQDNFASTLYSESFFGHCTCEAAVEFCKLMEALDNDSFVVKAKPSKSTREILPCENLDVIVKSILKDGKKVNAEKVISASFVYILMIAHLEKSSLGRGCGSYDSNDSLPTLHLHYHFRTRCIIIIKWIRHGVQSMFYRVLSPTLSFLSFGVVLAQVEQLICLGRCQGSQGKRVTCKTEPPLLCR